MDDKEQVRQAIADIIRDHYRKGDPIGWFEAVYASVNGDASRIPWGDLNPNPALVEWFEQAQVHAGGKSAVVVGCGLGDDAEFLAVRGYQVTAFDVSETAIAWCKRRFPESKVDYQVGDLFKLDPNWLYDFVVEIYTVQALPTALRERATSCIARLVEVGGYLLAIGRYAESVDEQQLLPWPLTRAELDGFVRAGLTEVQVEIFMDQEAPPVRRFRALYKRPT